VYTAALRVDIRCAPCETARIKGEVTVVPKILVESFGHEVCDDTLDASASTRGLKLNYRPRITSSGGAL